MRKVFLIISAATLLLAGCQKEQLVDNRAYNGPVTVVGATFEKFSEDGTTKASVDDAGNFSWQVDDQAAFTESSSTAYCLGTNAVEGLNAQFGIEGTHTFSSTSWAFYPYDLTTGQSPTTLKVKVPASREWKEGQTNVAMYGVKETSTPAFDFNHMGGLVRVRVNNVPTNAREFVFQTTGCKINGEFAVTENGGKKIISTGTPGTGEDTYTLTWTSAPEVENHMDFYIPLPVGSYNGGFAFYLKDGEHNILYKKVGTTPQTVARRQLLLMPPITLMGGVIEPVEKAAVAVEIPAGYSGDYLLPQTEKVLLKINASSGDHNITLKYDGVELPTYLEIKVIGDDENYNAILAGNLPQTHVEFTSGHIDYTSLTTSSSTLAVINPASVGTLTVKGGNVLLKGAAVTSIIVDEAAVASEETQAPVQIVVEKSEAETPVYPTITAKANVVVAPAENVTVTVTVPEAAQEQVQVANDGAGKVKDENGNEIETKATAKIGDIKYITLADAVAAVKNNEQIDIIAEEISATAIPIGSKKFTIDLGNKEVTVVGPAVGSSQTMNQAFQINSGNTITIKNGTIKCDNTNNIFRFVIQNYADLTLEDVTVDGTNLKNEGRTDAYTVSGNYGNIKFTGNTTVKASTVSGVDAYAIDLYDYTKHGYTEPAAGVWDSDGSITGAITLGGGSLTVSKELKLTKPMKAYKGDNGIVNLTVNANIIPGDNFDGDALVIVNRGGDLTISGSGKVSNNNNAGIYCAVKMTEAADVASNSEINRAKLTVKGTVTLEGYNAGISGNGNTGRGNTDVTIEGGTIKGCKTNGDECCGIYQPQVGTLTIKGGTIEGLVGVYVKSGSVTTAVSGGTIKGTGAKGTYSPTGNGFINTGDAIVFDNCDYPGGAPNAEILGGTFTSANGDAVASYAKSGNDPITGFIKGGTFSSKPADDLLASGYAATENGGVWTVAVKPIAKVGDVEYASLEAALNAAKAAKGGKVTLVDDVTLTRTDYKGCSSSDEDFATRLYTIDLNGHKISGGLFAFEDCSYTIEDGVGGGSISRDGSCLQLNVSQFMASKMCTFSTCPTFTVKGGEFIGAGDLNNPYSCKYGAQIGAMGTYDNTMAVSKFLISGGKIRNMRIYNGKGEISGGAFEGQLKIEVCTEGSDRYASGVTYSDFVTTITGGTFNLAETNPIFGADYAKDRLGEHLQIKGGTFNFNPSTNYSACIHEGYTSKDNGNGTWTVVETN